MLGRQNYIRQNHCAWAECLWDTDGYWKAKSHSSPGIEQILAEFTKAGGRTIRTERHKLIISFWNKEELPEEWKESIIEPVYAKGDKTDCGNYRGISFC
jgi:hypothetical protein